jgi:predicted RNase H-like HicB family nuclease
MTRYVAILDGVEGAYGIVFPDLPGCTAAGGTIADVVADAIGACASGFSTREGTAKPFRNLGIWRH